MLTGLIIYPESAAFPFYLGLRNFDSGYSIRGIDGLDPGKAESALTSFVGKDGAVLHGIRRGARNIVLTLGLHDGMSLGVTIDILRQQMYQNLRVGSTVLLRFAKEFWGSTVYREITGIVESVESPIFTNDAIMTVSIICPDPDLLNVIQTPFTGTTTSSWTTSKTLTYNGTVPTGFVIQYQNPLSTARTMFRVENVVNGKSQNFYATGIDLQQNQIVTLDTRAGQKAFYKQAYAGASRVNLMNTVDLYAKWPKLYYGANVIKAGAGAANQNYTITYVERFEGL